MNDYPTIYAVINIDKEIRMQSSSGGFFYLIAKYVIQNDGVVFGAKFNANWEVEHDYSDNMDGVRAFMGSKYVQSSVKNAFKKTKTFLETGRLVLFSGTPCQIYGLQSFLGKNYTNLILLDLVCHGVPSSRIWKEYLEMRSNGREVVDINFRDKTDGWLDYSLNMKFSDGSSYRMSHRDDLYMKGFLHDIYLRPSCYECKFKGVKRDSDFTLADLWGCQNMIPELFDDMGTSLVLVQSDKGKQIMEALHREIRIYGVQGNMYQKNNPNMISSVNNNWKRKLYNLNRSWNMIEWLTKPAGPVRKLLGTFKREVVYKIIERCK